MRGSHTAVVMTEVSLEIPENIVVVFSSPELASQSPPAPWRDLSSLVPAQ